MRRIKIMLERLFMSNRYDGEVRTILVQSPPNDGDLGRDVNICMESFEGMFYLEPLLLGSYSRSSDSRT